MQESDVLLLLNEPDLHRYIPGKIYDYIAAGKPVLVYGEGGEVASLVRHFAAGVVVPSGDSRALEQALAAMPARPRRGLSAGTKDWLQRHTRERLALRLVDVLNKVCAGGEVTAVLW